MQQRVFKCAYGKCLRCTYSHSSITGTCRAEVEQGQYGQQAKSRQHPQVFKFDMLQPFVNHVFTGSMMLIPFLISCHAPSRSFAVVASCANFTKSLNCKVCTNFFKSSCGNCKACNWRLKSSVVF